jgi:hypothetical protein
LIIDLINSPCPVACIYAVRRFWGERRDRVTVVQTRERLLAHARLCRQIARQSWNEDTAAELEWLAQECDRAAAQDIPVEPQNGPLH